MGLSVHIQSSHLSSPNSRPSPRRLKAKEYSSISPITVESKAVDIIDEESPNPGSADHDDNQEEKDRDISFGVTVQRSPRTTTEEENNRDRSFEDATKKVENIRHKPKSLQESLYYNREMARSEKAANRAEEVLKRELKQYGNHGEQRDDPAGDDNKERPATAQNPRKKRIIV